MVQLVHCFHSMLYKCTVIIYYGREYYLVGVNHYFKFATQSNVTQSKLSIFYNLIKRFPTLKKNRYDSFERLIRINMLYNMQYTICAL